jgi:hypothetical protein
MAVLAQPVALPRAQPIDGFAAEVDGTIITVGDVISDIRGELAALSNRYQGAALREAQREVFEEGLEQRIEEELQIAKFNKLGAQLPPGIVRERSEMVKRDRFKGDRVAFQAALAAAGTTEQEWEDELRKGLIVQSMIQQQVRSKIHVAPREIRDAYERRKEEFQEPVELELRAIAFRPASGEEAAEQAKRIELVRSKLAEGADFSELAKAFSEGPKASQGGYQGWVNVDNLPDPMPEALREMEAGGITDWVETPILSYFFQVLNRRGGGGMTLVEAQPVLEQEIRERKFERAYEVYIQGLKDEFQILRFNPDISAVTGEL